MTNLSKLTVTPAQMKLAVLRSQWRLWHQLDPEQAAATWTVNPPREHLAATGGDRVAAWRTFRDEMLTETELLGRALIALIEQESQEA